MKKGLFNELLRLGILILCGTILGVNVYLANARNLVGNHLPMPFGIGAAVVLSGSMEPELSVGDLILVKETDEIEVNDIVVYQQMSSLIVHRVIDVQDDVITTQGDANNVADEPVSVDTVKGKVFLSVPYVGNIVNFLKTPVGILLTILAAIALVEIPRRKEMKQNDDERQKLIDEINELKKEVYDK